MDLKFSPEDEAFRLEVRQWFRDNTPPDIRRKTDQFWCTPADMEDTRRFTRMLNARGWGAPAWPVEYGGTGWDHVRQHIFEEERYNADAPDVHWAGVKLVGPVIYTYGSQAQKDFYLPKILNLDHIWAQGFSEPGSGSDLASLRTRAEDKGDHWLVNGQKIWTSSAHEADWGFFLVKTGNDPKPQKNISFLLVDMKTPGITVRPIIALNGVHELNEVFLEDVKVPKENIVGEVNKGWSYGKFLLENERTTSAFLYLNKRELEHVKQIARAEIVDGKPLIEQPEFRAKLARVEAKVLGLDWSVMRVLCNEKSRYDTNAVASVLKVRGSELQQAVSELAMDVLGPRSLRYFPHVKNSLIYDDEPADLWPTYVPGRTTLALFHRAATIYGGTKQVQKGIIAKLAFNL